MAKNKKQQRNKQYFSQQKNFGDWKNLLEPPITFAEMISKITITRQAPHNFLADFAREYPELRAIVVQQ